MRVYNRKKEFIGWVNKEEGNLVLSKYAEDDGTISVKSKRDSLYSLMYNLIFWMLAGDVLGFLGYAVILERMNYFEPNLPSFWMISSGNILYMAPIGFLIQLFALVYVSFRNPVFLSASFICSAQAVLAILVESGAVKVDWTVFIISMSLSLAVPICLGVLFGIILREDLRTLTHQLSFLPILILLVFGTAFGVVFYSAISFGMYPLYEIAPADIIPYFGSLSEGDTPGKAMFFYRMTMILFYIIGIVILQLVLKKEDRK